MTNYKQLCADLIDALDSGIPSARIRSSPLASRARAALAEPEPEDPTDLQPIPLGILADIFSNTERPDKISVTLAKTTRDLIVKYRDLDDEWLKELSAALAEPEPEPPTGEEIMALMPQQMHEDLAFAARAMAEHAGTDSTRVKGAMRIMLNGHVVDLARAVLARWGNHPAKPDTSLQPIPVSERMPGPEDCDGQGMCWWYCAPAERWLRCGIPEPNPASHVHTHWLPAHALPLPTHD